MEKQSIYAVLTGDLIESRKASDAKVSATFEALQAAAADFGQMRGQDLRFTRFRGDGWQVLLSDPGATLDAMLFLTARLRATGTPLATRIAVGVGPINTAGSGDLSDASGPAFFTSGGLIDQLSPKRQFAIAGDGIGPSEVAIIALAEFISAGWTANQAEAVAHALHKTPRTHDKIAQSIGITRQAVQNRLAGAGFSYLETALSALRSHRFTTQPADTF